MPADVRQQLRLEVGERVLAGATDASGGWTVGTDRALHLAHGEGWRRLPWERVDRASFDDETEQLQVVEVADFGLPEPTHVLVLIEPRRLLDLVRERVTASVLLSRHVRLPDSGGAKVIARRSPVGGPVEWSFWLADDVAPDDSQVRAALDLALADAEAELGL